MVHYSTIGAHLVTVDVVVIMCVIVFTIMMTMIFSVSVIEKVCMIKFFQYIEFIIYTVWTVGCLIIKFFWYLFLLFDIIMRKPDLQYVHIKFYYNFYTLKVKQDVLTKLTLLVQPHTYCMN